MTKTYGVIYEVIYDVIYEVIIIKSRARLDRAFLSLENLVICRVPYERIQQIP